MIIRVIFHIEPGVNYHFFDASPHFALDCGYFVSIGNHFAVERGYFAGTSNHFAVERGCFVGVCNHFAVERCVPEVFYGHRGYEIRHCVSEICYCVIQLSYPETIKGHFISSLAHWHIGTLRLCAFAVKESASSAYHSF